MLDRWDALVFLAVAAHALVCPFTKVEESFQVQAVHDILEYGPDLDKYDHVVFPGVVPRSFVGPLLLAVLCFPAALIPPTLLARVGELLQHASSSSSSGGGGGARVLAALPIVNMWFSPHGEKLHLLLAMRLMMGFVSVVTLGVLRRAFAFRFHHANASNANATGRPNSSSNNTSNAPVAVFMALLTVSQFHLVFYMSRPLANCFAMWCTNLAFASWLRGGERGVGRAVGMFAAACVIFRCDVIILALPFIAIALVMHYCCGERSEEASSKQKGEGAAALPASASPSMGLSMGNLLRSGILYTLVALAVVLPIDTYFWRPQQQQQQQQSLSTAASSFSLSSTPIADALLSLNNSANHTTAAASSSSHLPSLFGVVWSQRLLGVPLMWPELEVLHFNTADPHRSSQWGTLPFAWYLTSALPRALLVALLFLPFALCTTASTGSTGTARSSSSSSSSNRKAANGNNGKSVGNDDRNSSSSGSGSRNASGGGGDKEDDDEKDSSQRLLDNRSGGSGGCGCGLSLQRASVPLLLTVSAFVGLYSFLPHKELRFIFPALPVLNGLAAVGLHNCLLAARACARACACTGASSSSSSSASPPSVNKGSEGQGKHLRVERASSRFCCCGSIGSGSGGGCRRCLGGCCGRLVSACATSGVSFLLLVSFVAACFMLYTSSFNYGGGHALVALHRSIDADLSAAASTAASAAAAGATSAAGGAAGVRSSQPGATSSAVAAAATTGTVDAVHKDKEDEKGQEQNDGDGAEEVVVVHVCNLAATTGVSRFGQVREREEERATKRLGSRSSSSNSSNSNRHAPFVARLAQRLVAKLAPFLGFSESTTSDTTSAAAAANSDSATAAKHHQQPQNVAREHVQHAERLQQLRAPPSVVYSKEENLSADDLVRAARAGHVHYLIAEAAIVGEDNKNNAAAAAAAAVDAAGAAASSPSASSSSSSSSSSLSSPPPSSPAAPLLQQQALLDSGAFRLVRQQQQQQQARNRGDYKATAAEAAAAAVMGLDSVLWPSPRALRDKAWRLAGTLRTALRETWRAFVSSSPSAASSSSAAAAADDDDPAATADHAATSPAAGAAPTTTTTTTAATAQQRHMMWRQPWEAVAAAVEELVASALPRVRTRPWLYLLKRVDSTPKEQQQQQRQEQPKQQQHLP